MVWRGFKHVEMVSVTLPLKMWSKYSDHEISIGHISGIFIVESKCFVFRERLVFNVCE